MYNIPPLICWPLLRILFVLFKSIMINNEQKKSKTRKNNIFLTLSIIDRFKSIIKKLNYN